MHGDRFLFISVHSIRNKPDMGSREEAVDFTKRGNECKLYI